MKRKADYLDKEEQEIIEAYERGEFVPVKNQKRMRMKIKEAAENHLRKNARINIRLSESDLLMLKRKAAEEGIPYQTLAAGLLHKYVNGSIVNNL